MGLLTFCSFHVQYNFVAALHYCVHLESYLKMQSIVIMNKYDNTSQMTWPENYVSENWCISYNLSQTKTKQNVKKTVRECFLDRFLSCFIINFEGDSAFKQ